MRSIVKVMLAVAAVLALGVILLPSPVMVAEAQATPQIPEPSSLALMAAGLGLVAIYHKVRKRK